MTKIDELMQILANDFTATTYGASQNFREALEAALAEPEQEPVGWSITWNGEHVGNFYHYREIAEVGLIEVNKKYPDALREIAPLYIRPATPLSATKIRELVDEIDEGQEPSEYLVSLVRAVESVHGIGVKK